MDVEELRMEIDRLEERQASLKLLVIQCEQARQEHDRQLKLLRQALTHASSARELNRELASPITAQTVDRLLDQMPAPKQIEGPEE